jgi:hypothetical protein
VPQLERLEQRMAATQAGERSLLAELLARIAALEEARRGPDSCARAMRSASRTGKR